MMKLNLVLNYQGFEDYLLVCDCIKDGLGRVRCLYLFGFENGYGAVVTKRPRVCVGKDCQNSRECNNGYTENLWELEVIRYADKDCVKYDYEECNSPFAREHSIGRLTDSEVRNLLQKIKEL